MYSLSTFIDLKIILSLCVVSLSLLYWFCQKRKNLPPGPLCLPIIGCVIWLVRNRLSKKRWTDVAKAESKKYGNVIYGTMAGFELVLLVGYNTIHDAFVQQADITSDRPTPHWIQGLKVPKTKKSGYGILWQTGERVKILRKFTHKSLREFGLGKTQLEDLIFEEIEASTEHFHKFNGDPADVNSVSSKMIANIICSIMFGKRFSYDDTVFNEFQQNLKYIMNGGGALDPMRHIPTIYLKLFHKKKLEDIEHHEVAVKWVRKYIYKEIAEHEEHYDKNNIRDFIDLYIQKREAEGEVEDEVFTLRNMFQVIMDVFMSGLETTYLSISWSILYMIEYPEIQRKCQEEIKEKIGNRRVQWSDKAELPYIEATMLEILRKASVGPFSLPHLIGRDMTIDGYFIPKNTILLADFESCNNDKNIWMDPLKFSPERFLNSSTKRCPSFLPFGLGPRACVGENLAKMELFLIFTNLLQRFDFKREKDSVPTSFECNFEMSLNAPVDFKTRAISRT